MQFSTIAILSAIVGFVAAGDPAQVRYDTIYDTSAQSTLTVACSDGINGLYTKGYHTLGAIPNFPMIGAAAKVTGWNSDQCGRCFKIYWAQTGKSIYVTAVDVARAGDFVLSKAAFDALTNNQSALGTITAAYAPADRTMCKM